MKSTKCELPKLRESCKKSIKEKNPHLDSENNDILGNRDYLHSIDAMKLEEKLRKEYKELTSELLVY